MENFVVECRRKVQLEMLRSDLHVYLKILQSAMVELINKDYADFVNLSTNLVCYSQMYVYSSASSALFSLAVIGGSRGGVPTIVQAR